MQGNTCVPSSLCRPVVHILKSGCWNMALPFWASVAPQYAYKVVFYYTYYMTFTLMMVLRMYGRTTKHSNIFPLKMRQTLQSSAFRIKLNLNFISAF